MSQEADQTSVNSTTAFQWADGLGRVFRHVALFDIRGTVARVAGVHGLSPAVVGRSLSLSAQTPLRWSLEAASALVSSGNSPGGTIVSKGLGLKRPKAFAILPLMVQGKLVAIAYVDNGEATLSMSTVSKVFAVVDASLRNDITYVKELKDTPESALANPTTAPASKGLMGTFDTTAPKFAPVPIKTRPQYEPEPDDLDEIEAMIDEALANNPLVEKPLEQEPEEESPVVVSLHDHILNRDEQTVAEAPPIVKDSEPAEVRPLFTAGKTEPDADSIDELLTDVAEDDEAVEPVEVETRAVIEPLPPKTINRRFRSESAKSADEKREERKARLREVISENEMFAEKEHDGPSLAPEWDETVAREVPTAFRGEAPPPPSLEGAPTEVFDIENRATAEHQVPATARVLNFKFPKRFLIAAGIAAILGAGTMGILAPPAGGPPAGFTFRIHPNSSLSQIAMHLQRQGVIRNGLVFKALAKTRGMERGLRAGRYSIPQGAWAWDVLNELNRGQVRTRDVTIPEGLTLQETAEIIEASGLVTVEKFLKAARNSELIQAYGIQAPTAEGYLFPETYTFAEELSAEDIVKEMIDLFFTRFTQLADNREMGPTELMEYVTLASIIEREAKAPNEMSRIAGVFRNRLTRNMRLESCATVQYILGKPKERLLLSDLRKESPYNTYLKPGLPPGPISNPGLKALQASLNPEEHSYLFFLAKNDGSNEHVFTQTYAQHQKARLLQKQTGGGR